MDIFGIAWENIFIGVLSGGVVGLSTIFKKHIENYFIERKFPIAGDYISKFEDEIDGNIEIVTAPVELQQKGRKVMGVTELENDDRRWIIDGEISSGGHMHGVYYAEDPYDKGIGNFFLYINHKKYMEGLWSGFDSVNRKITSGRYSFMPTLKNLVIEDFVKNELPSIIEISDKELGKDYLPENMKGLLEHPDTIFRVAKTSKDGILGFCYCFSMTPDDIYKLGIKKLPKVIKYSSKVGVLKTIAVKHEFQGRGIATALIDNIIEAMKFQNIQSIVSIAWKSKKGINIQGIMNHYEFSLFDEIAEFWKEDSIENNYTCPECGEPPCLCSAAMYLKTLTIRCHEKS